MKNADRHAPKHRGCVCFHGGDGKLNLDASRAETEVRDCAIVPIGTRASVDPESDLTCEYHFVASDPTLPYVSIFDSICWQLAHRIRCHMSNRSSSRFLAETGRSLPITSDSTVTPPDLPTHVLFHLPPA